MCGRPPRTGAAARLYTVTAPATAHCTLHPSRLPLSSFSALACYPSLPLLRPPSDPLTVSFGRSHPFPEGPHLPDQRHRLDRGRNGDRTPAFSAPACGPLYDGDGPAGGRRKMSLGRRWRSKFQTSRRRSAGGRGNRAARPSHSPLVNAVCFEGRTRIDSCRGINVTVRSQVASIPTPLQTPFPLHSPPRRPSPPGRRRPPRAPPAPAPFCSREFLASSGNTAGARRLRERLNSVPPHDLRWTHDLRRKHRWRTPAAVCFLSGILGPSRARSRGCLLTRRSPTSLTLMPLSPTRMATAYLRPRRAARSAAGSPSRVASRPEASRDMPD